MASLFDVTSPRPAGDRYQLDVAEGWLQGRGAFGGLVFGSLIRAIESKLGDPARQLRSLTAEVPGPVERGTVEIAVEALRHGKNMSTMRAALSQHGEVRGHAVAILASNRPSAAATSWNEMTPPELPDWASIEPAPLVRGGGWPEFTQHFEYRLVEGMPLGGKAARALGWIRPRDPGAPRDAAYIAAMIDAWWPAALARFTAWRPMATIAFTLHIAGGVDGLDPEAPLAYRATAPVCGDGYFLETRELWGGDGRLVAVNQQTFAIIQ
jgi:acyl-CoA thioesterase